MITFLRAALLVPLLGSMGATVLSAQASSGWGPSVYPSGCTLSGNSGVQLGIGVGFTDRADSLDRWPLDAQVSGGFGYGLQGSWFASMSFRAPGLWRRWRLIASAVGQRQVRFDFAGLGSTSVYDPTLVTDSQPFYYELKRTQYTVNVEGTRALGAGVSIALALGVREVVLDSLPGPSVFETLRASELDETDRSARVSIVLDRRDHESDPQRGFLLEVGGTVASGGGGYQRLTAIGQGYVPVSDASVVALRVAVSGTAGSSPPLSTRFTIPVWEGSIDVLGAPTSHRGLRSQRYVGRHVVFGNGELRHRLATWRRVKILGLGFVDAGRVFETEPFQVTLSHLKFGAGLGLGAKFKSGSIVVFNGARGPDGFVFSGRSGWMF